MVLCKWVIIKMLQVSILQTLVSMAHKQKRPAFLRGVWSGKRDSNFSL